MGSALIGIFAIPAIYALARVWFGTSVALSATFLLAVSRWYLIASRGGFRYSFSPVMAALTGLFLLRALRYRRRNDFLLLGFVLGVGMYTYTAFRVIPLAVVACLWIELMLDIIRRPDGWERARRTFINALLAAAWSPCLSSCRWAVLRWSIPLTSGAAARHGLPSAERPLPGHPVAIFLDNVKNAELDVQLPR